MAVPRGFVDIEEENVVRTPTGPSYPHSSMGKLVDFGRRSSGSDGHPLAQGFTRRGSSNSTAGADTGPVYGSKRDLWEKTPPAKSSFKKDSIFFGSDVSPMIPAQSSPLGLRAGSVFNSPGLGTGGGTVASPASSMPTATTSTSSPQKRSRNSIFDIPQVVTKPALKMTEEELADLRSGGGSAVSTFASSSTSDTADTDAMMVDSPPLSPAAATVTGAGAKPPVYPPRIDTYNKPIFGGFGTSQPTSPYGVPSSPRRSPHSAVSNRRSWVDLDENTASGLLAPTSSSSPRPSPMKPIYPTVSKSSVSDETMPPPAASTHAIARQRSSPALPSTSFSVSKMHRFSAGAVEPGASALLTSSGLNVITNPGGAFDSINLSFLPIRKNFLGEGRYAQVYLGQYTISGEEELHSATSHESSTSTIRPAGITPRDMSPSSSSVVTAGTEANIETSARVMPMSPQQLPTPTMRVKSPLSSSASATAPATTRINNPANNAFLTCAVKRMHNTPECQAIGLAELFVLRRLGCHHPNIVRLIGAKDETDVDSIAVRNRIKSASFSTAATTTTASPIKPSASQHNYQHHQLHLYNNHPVNSHHTSHSAFGNTLSGLDSSPRLLILLGFEAGGTMWDYIEDVKDVGIGQDLWTKWAGQLASAVDYVHSFGIVHHDIKPHNCLLSEELDLRLADFGNACFVPGFQSPTYLVDPVLGPFPPSSTGPHITATVSGSVQKPALNGPSPEPPSPTASISSTTSSKGSLRDGLGRGTQAYSAPELFAFSAATPSSSTTPSSSDGLYSFPVDIYSVGVTMYVMVVCHDPFINARSSVHMMMAIRKGFWASSMQPNISPSGPLIPPRGNLPPIGAHDYLRFPNGDLLEAEAVRLLCACVEKNPASRPTARALVSSLRLFEEEGRT